MRLVSSSSAEVLTLSLPCKSQPWHGSAPALSPDSEVPCSRTGTTFRCKGSEAVLWSHPSLLYHTPPDETKQKHNRERQEATDRHYSTHPSTSEEIPDFCPTPLCMANQIFTSELLKRWSANAEFPISSLWETKTKVNMPISCLLPSLPEALVGPEPGVWSQCSSLSRHSRVKAQEQKWGHQGAMSG